MEMGDVISGVRHLSGRERGAPIGASQLGDGLLHCDAQESLPEQRAHWKQERRFVLAPPSLPPHPDFLLPRLSAFFVWAPPRQVRGAGWPGGYRRWRKRPRNRAGGER